MTANPAEPEAPHDEWTAPTRRFSPFVALCTAGFSVD